jgi:hypothetical protein
VCSFIPEHCTTSTSWLMKRRSPCSLVRYTYSLSLSLSLSQASWSASNKEKNMEEGGGGSECPPIPLLYLLPCLERKTFLEGSLALVCRRASKLTKFHLLNPCMTLFWLVVLLCISTSRREWNRTKLQEWLESGLWVSVGSNTCKNWSNWLRIT